MLRNFNGFSKQWNAMLVAIVQLLLFLNQLQCGHNFPATHRYAHLPLPPRPANLINGEQISTNYFLAAEHAASAKGHLQGLLYNFLENLQRNLTTSTVLNTMVNTIDMGKTKRQLRKLHDLANFFEVASESAVAYATQVENYFEITKNESNALLLKLRRVPTGHRLLPMQVKMYLTNYFTEMEFFHVSFTEVIDEALEYIVDTLRSTQQTFLHYADVQRDVLQNWNFKPDEWCCNRYMDFLQHWSATIFKCAAGRELHIAYDVYAMTEITTKYILRQEEFRIQRLFNCFQFPGNYEIRCRFLHNAEQDFEKMFAKLDELQMYFDVKTKQGRITSYRRSRRRRQHMPTQAANVEKLSPTAYKFDQIELQDKCLPYGFPDAQMQSGLKTCFYFPDLI